MNRNKYNQQLDRLSQLSQDGAISLEFVKQLVEAKTGKPVKSIIAKQVFGNDADYTDNNGCFYAISATFFPVGNVVAPVQVCPVISGLHAAINADQLSFSFNALTGLQQDATVYLYKNGVLVDTLDNYQANSGAFTIAANKTLNTKVGALVSPASVQMGVINALNLSIVRVGTFLSDTNFATTWRSIYASGKTPHVVLNWFHFDGEHDFYSDVAAYKTALSSIADELFANGVRLVAIENEENNLTYRALAPGSAQKYLALLAAAYQVLSPFGISVMNGGVTGGAGRYIAYKWLEVNEPGNAALFLENEFETNVQQQIVAGTFETVGNNGLLCDFIRAVLGGLQAAGATYCNIHHYFEPLEDQSSVPYVDGFLMMCRAFAALSGLPVVSNEIGQYNSLASYPANILPALFDAQIPFICWYSGFNDGTDAVALQDGSGALAANGVAFRDTLLSYGNNAANYGIDVRANCSASASALAHVSVSLAAPAKPVQTVCSIVTGPTIQVVNDTSLLVSWNVEDNQIYSVRLYQDGDLYLTKVALAPVQFDNLPDGKYYATITHNCAGNDAAPVATVKVTVTAPAPAPAPEPAPEPAPAPTSVQLLYDLAGYQYSNNNSAYTPTLTTTLSKATFPHQGNDYTKDITPWAELRVPTMAQSGTHVFNPGVWNISVQMASTMSNNLFIRVGDKVYSPTAKTSTAIWFNNIPLDQDFYLTSKQTI